MAREATHVGFVDHCILLQDARLGSGRGSAADHDGLRRPGTCVELSPYNWRMQIFISCVWLRTRAVHAGVVVMKLLHLRSLPVVRQLASIGIEKELVGIETVAVRINV